MTEEQRFLLLSTLLLVGAAGFKVLTHHYQKWCDKRIDIAQRETLARRQVEFEELTRKIRNDQRKKTTP